MSTGKLTEPATAPRRWLGIERLSLRQLEALAIIVPMAFLSSVYVVVVGPVHPFGHTLAGFIPLAAILLIAVLAFTRTVFGAVRALQAEVEALHSQTQGHNRQLVQLHDANLALTHETTADLAMQRIAELGRDLSGACHSILEVTERDGGTHVVTYPESRPAEAACLLEGGLELGPDDARPADNSHLVVVPLRHFEQRIGTLYLARTELQPPFDSLDKGIANMFGTHAARNLSSAGCRWF